MPVIKHIFVTGGVTSSLGKGIIAASLGRLLLSRGYRITIQKLDPYINIDPGTMNPIEHGECFVTDDGAETDLDLGHYERFLDITTTQANNTTTGKVYHHVITKERRGDYLGKTVQVIPHITDEIKQCIFDLEQQNLDIIITEIGGCVGDIESLPFIEAIRQVKWEYGEKNCLVIHLTLLPYLHSTQEIKTKPTQHSVKKLLETGIQPDILICRTSHTITPSIRQKISLFCNVAKQDVIEAKDVDTIYAVPLSLHKEGFDLRVLEKLSLSKYKPLNMNKWDKLLQHYYHPSHTIHVGIVGKYTILPDAYKSITEALCHAGMHLKCKINIHFLDAEKINKEYIDQHFPLLEGVIVAPGFGNRGIQGKIRIIKHVRENHIPFLGICLGMQCAVVEFAQNVLGWKNASSTEYDPQTPYPVIDLMEKQKNIIHKGGSMRLGAHPCALRKHTKTWQAYKKENIKERHRHRYEFNYKYLAQFEQKGMQAVGINPENKLIEIVEIFHHPFFIGTQFHPEYKSTVLNPHPLFIQFIHTILLSCKN